MARDEAVLVAHAADLRFDHFARALAYWAQRADPAGAEEAAERRRDGRRLHLSQGFGGAWVLDAMLDPVAGAVVSERLGAIEDELFEAEWAALRSGWGEQAGAAHLPRTPAQRRADALVEMATRAGAVPAGARRPEPLFSVLVGYETFVGPLCEVAGTPVAPGSLAPWLEQAWIERAVFDSPSRVIDVGVLRRLFAGATRRGVVLRDRECFHELCDVPAGHCEVDHVIPWSAGGPTTIDNGRAACGFHNRERHRPP